MKTPRPRLTTRILIVDDHAPIRNLVARTLSHEGYEICGMAEEGKEAIEKEKTLRPDLILMDLSMPKGLDGYLATRLIRRTNPTVKILVFTSNVLANIQQSALDMGANGAVQKGDLPALVAAVKEMMI